MSNVIPLVDASGSAAHWSVEQMLEFELAAIRAGQRPTRKAILLYVDTENGRFTPSYTLAGMRMSECISLTEMAKARFVHNLTHG